MFGLGTQELVIILFIAFFIFGAKRLPEIGSGLGKAIRGFKEASKDANPDAKEGKKDIQATVETSKEGNSHSRKNLIEKELEKLPGVKEVQQIKEKADKLKQVSKLVLKK